jgi:hypothetical protein
MSNKYVFLIEDRAKGIVTLKNLKFAMSHYGGRLWMMTVVLPQKIGGGWYESLDYKLHYMSPKENKNNVIKMLTRDSVSLKEAMRAKHNYLSSSGRENRKLKLKIIPLQSAKSIINSIPLEVEEPQGLGRTIHRLRKIKEKQKERSRDKQKERSRDKQKQHGLHPKF